MKEFATRPRSSIQRATTPARRAPEKTSPTPTRSPLRASAGPALDPSKTIARLLDNTARPPTSPLILAPDHASERAADRVADGVVRSLRDKTPAHATRDPGPLVRADAVMRAGAGPGAARAPQRFAHDLAHSRGGGSPIAAPLRQRLESSMGAPFGDVRVHTGQRADSLSKSIRARAFTQGNDIFFRSGAYEPGTDRGMHLLAHELTHVAQQRGSHDACSRVVQRVIVEHETTGDYRQETELLDDFIGQIITSHTSGTRDTMIERLYNEIKSNAERISTDENANERLRNYLVGLCDQLSTQLSTTTDQTTKDQISARIKTSTSINLFMERLGRLTGAYKKSMKTCRSHGDPSLNVTHDWGVITAVSTSDNRFFGKIHALATLEYLDTDGTPHTIKCDIAGGARGGYVAPVAVRDVQSEGSVLAKLQSGTNKRSWLAKKNRIDAAEAKARDVKEINEDPDSEFKYIYRRTGRSMLDVKNKSINCARYVAKILKAANIEASAGGLFLTPQEIATGTKLSKHWGPKTS
ncbi:MAG: DUF4157 domain-containing protein [Nannocystaceae bacterium]